MNGITYENPHLRALAEKAAVLPETPGVYLMKNAKGDVIYIGKARRLKQRVLSYFRGKPDRPKTARLVENIRSFEFITANTELDALVLEAGLIGIHKPKYNILLKDNSRFIYIKVDGGAYPKITHAVSKNDKSSDKAEYFGPYAYEYSVRRAVEEVNTLFALPTCTRRFPEDFGKERPCLNYYMHMCVGVCTGNVAQSDYSALITEAKIYLKSGMKSSIERLKTEMEKASEELKFERAAAIRDRIKAIEKSRTRQRVEIKDTGVIDAVGLAQSRDAASFAVLHYADGVMHGIDTFILQGEGLAAGETVSDTLRRDFLVQFYTSAQKETLPDKIYIDELSDDNIAEVSQYVSHLKSTHGQSPVGDHACPRVSCKVKAAGGGEPLVLTTLAAGNAVKHLEVSQGKVAYHLRVLEVLRDILGMITPPLLIECCDISNIGNDSMTGAVTAFKDGKPYKSAYRVFNIKSTEIQNDFACMKETIYRRLKRYAEGDGKFAPLPDLLLIDGGKGQVGAALEARAQVLAEFAKVFAENEAATLYEDNLKNLVIAGLVKDDRHRTAGLVFPQHKGFYTWTPSKKRAKKTSFEIGDDSVMSLLTRIQDETHRFAVTTMKKRHENTSLSLTLTSVKGVGAAKAAELIKHFRSLENIRAASTEEIRKVAAVSQGVAEEIKNI